MLSLFAVIILTITPIQEEEVWYVWLDTSATISGQEVRLVGRQPFAITCCVKSGKFSRLEKNANKWVKKNYDPNFGDESALKKIQDEDLAREIVERAVQRSETDQSVRIIDYSDTCN